MIRCVPLAVLAALCACTTSNLGNPAILAVAAPGAVIEGEFIVRADLPDNALADLDLERVDYDEGLAAGLYRADSALSLTALKARLDAELVVDVEVEENRVVSALGVNDDYRDLQWNLDLLDIDTAWQTSTGAGITVAVIDTGVARIGEDAPLHIAPGWDWVDNDADPTDENGHGTHVAGTIAQATNNGRGVAGVAYDATILPLRVLDENGSGSTYWSAKAVRYAADNGADVINLSLGSAYSSNTERSAIDYAVSRDVIVVAASGNDGKSSLDYPAGYAGVIAVGAVGASSAAAPYSNGGTGLDLVAPGGDMSRDRDNDGYADGILQETLDGNGTSYQFFEGTSMATPHVAGIAALLLAAGARPDEVEGLLKDTAKDLGAAGWDTWTGEGLVDPVAALAALGGGGGGGGGNAPADTTGPVITGVGGSKSGNSLRIWWTTDEPSSTEIEFRDYGLFGEPGASETQHELSFTVNPGSTYYFTVISEDAAGNRTEDGVWYL